MVTGSVNGHVLVIGAAGIDVKGRPESLLKPGMHTSGQVRFSLGGVARNIAENLARLEIQTTLLTAVGDDPYGAMVFDSCTAAGIDTGSVMMLSGARTGGFIALMTDENKLAAGISDYSIVDQITPDMLYSREGLFASAMLLVLDANLSTEALDAVFDMAQRYNVPVCADPTSPTLAGKFCSYLAKLYMIAPNSAETTALCGLSVPAHDPETAIKAARQLVALGVQIAIVTLDEQGLAYADSSSSGIIPAIHTHIVDTTGAGDALTAAVIFGLLNNVPLDEAMRLGVTAASLTLRTRESVVPELSQELLYDELVI